MTLQENRIDWAALDEITNRILDHATSPRLEQNEQNEQEVDGGSYAIESQRCSNAIVAKE